MARTKTSVKKKYLKIDSTEAKVEKMKPKWKFIVDNHLIDDKKKEDIPKVGCLNPEKKGEILLEVLLKLY